MPNVDAPFGLRPVRYFSGAPYNGAAEKFFVPSTDNTAIYIGGLVRIAGSADANGIMTVTGNVATGNPVAGVVVGIEAESRDSTTYRVASTNRYVYVATDPNLLFECQCEGTLTATMIGNAADLTSFTSGSTVTGLSSMEVNLATVSASGDGTEDVVIWGVKQTPDNEIGAHANVLVRLNNHSAVDGYAGA
jgi:hypothetical protein